MTLLEGHIDLSGSEGLTDEDRSLLDGVDRAVSDGVALKRWWEQAHATKKYVRRCDLVREFKESLSSFAFFDEVSLGDQTLPVMGTVDQMLYDRQKVMPAENLPEQFREFILHYFMRVSSYHPPAAAVETGQPKHGDVRAFLRPLSWCPEGADRRAGFGYSQHYFKLRESGQVGKFRERDWYTIVDLREIGKTFEWVVVKVRVFDMSLTFRPFGSRSFTIGLPQEEHFYLVITPEFVTCQDNPTPGLLGRYGFGYVILRREEHQGILARSRDIFGTGFQLLDFELDDTGQSTVRMVLVINRPGSVLNMNLNPVGLGFALGDLMTLGLVSRLFSPVRPFIERLSPRIDNFDLVTAFISVADALSAGVSSEQLCISMETVEKEMLLQNFIQHYGLITDSIVTWRHVRDWLDQSQLPEEAIRGVST